MKSKRNGRNLGGDSRRDGDNIREGNGERGEKGMVGGGVGGWW